MSLAERALYRPSRQGVEIVAAASVGIALGMVSLVASPRLCMLLLVGGLLLYGGLKRPEIAVLAFLSVVVATGNQSQMPSFSLGVGTIYLSDMMLAGMLILVVIRLLVEKDFGFVHTSLDIPLALFYCTALLATGAGIMASRVTFRESLGELRVVSNYLIFFAVTNLVRETRQLKSLLRWLRVLAMAVALMMLVQYLMGEASPILGGRVETLWTEGVTFSSVVRIIPPGESVVVALFITTSVGLALRKAKWASILGFLEWGILGVAVVLTFKRNVWVGVCVVSLFLWYLLREQDRRRYVQWSLVILPVIPIVVLVVVGHPGSRFGRLATASVERLQSLLNSATYEDPNSSLRSRDIEYGYAFRQIESNPILGLGLGAAYRPTLAGHDSVDSSGGMTWIHNGHVWVALKTGLLGYIFFVWLSVLYLARGLRYWRSVGEVELRVAVLGFTLTYVVVLLGSVVNPNVVTWYWTPVLGVMMGFNEAVIKGLPSAKYRPGDERGLNRALQRRGLCLGGESGGEEE